MSNLDAEILAVVIHDAFASVSIFILPNFILPDLYQMTVH